MLVRRQVDGHAGTLRWYSRTYGGPPDGREPLSDDNIICVCYVYCVIVLGCALKSTKATGTQTSTAINPGDCIGVEGDSPRDADSISWQGEAGQWPRQVARKVNVCVFSLSTPIKEADPSGQGVPRKRCPG